MVIYVKRELLLETAYETTKTQKKATMAKDSRIHCDVFNSFKPHTHTNDCGGGVIEFVKHCPHFPNFPTTPDIIRHEPSQPSYINSIHQRWIR